MELASVFDDRTALAVAAGIYAASFFAGLVVILLRRSYPRSLMFAALACGFTVQTIGLNLRGAVIKACPLGNPFEISQFLAWSLVLLFFIIGPIFRLRLLGFFTAGLAALMAGGPFFITGWDRAYPPGIFGGNPWIELHAAMAIFSYGIFAILSLVSVMFLTQQYGLRRKHTRGIFQFLPSVQQLDLMAKRLLITGVIMLSLSLLCGALFWMENLQLVPVFKLSATCLVWAGYVAVCILRLKRRLVTRRHAIVCILLFLLAIASLWPVEDARSAHKEPQINATLSNPS